MRTAGNQCDAADYTFQTRYGSTPHTIPRPIAILGPNITKPILSTLKDPDRTRATDPLLNVPVPTSAGGPLLAVPVPRMLKKEGVPESRPRMNSISRTGDNSSPQTDPDHVFLTINPPYGLELNNLASKATVDELCERMLPMWPKGFVRQKRKGHDWRVRFTGSPWDSKGDESIVAQRMICRVFWVLAAQGYAYLTSNTTGRAFKTPRLVFIRSPADRCARFFAMSLNGAGNAITFVDPPAAVVNSLGSSLRTAFPHRVVNEHASDDGTFTITIKPGINAMSPKNMFMAHILKYIDDMTFRLDASVPLARRGLFGMGGRKTIWVFKGSRSQHNHT